MQNVGGALGVAVTGVIFFGALHRGYAHALELSLAELAALLLTVASLTRLLPAHRLTGAAAMSGSWHAAATREPPGDYLREVIAARTDAR